MVFSTTKTTAQVLDVQEAYNLYDMLTMRYRAVDQIQIFQNFIHDVDFSKLLQSMVLKEYQGQLGQLVKLANRFQVPLPQRPPASVKTPDNAEVITDEFIADMMTTLLQECINLHLRTVRTTVTSDDLRNIWIRYLNKELGLYDAALKYLKSKGWIASPPLYTQTPPDLNEQLDTGEAFHLWDHLTSRYDAIELTQIYEKQAHDGDLKQLLQIGLAEVLQTHVEKLEAEMNRFALPLPKRPPENAMPVQNQQIISDRLIFRRIFAGMQYFLELHATALKQNTTNDRLRKMYYQFIKDELSVLNQLIKYGKVKGWIRHAPLFRPIAGN